jgi:uncharacterized membrane protein
MMIVDTLAAVASGVTAGVYAHFAVRVMPRLGRMSAGNAVAAMQGLNEKVERAPFLAAFLGGGVLGGYQIVRYACGEAEVSGALAGAAGVAYLAGVVLTIAYNVPRNQRLARIEPDSAAADYWPRFHREWTRANAVRAGLSTASVGLGLAALIAGTMAR